MKFGWMLLLIACGLFAIRAFAAPGVPKAGCTHPGSMADMTQCSKEEFAQADALLDKTYQETIAKINAVFPASSDKDFNEGYKKALKASQDAWIKFREVDCDLSNFDRTGGSSQLMNIYGCKTDLTSIRIKELQDLIQIKPKL